MEIVETNEGEIMPRDLLEHYSRARKNTFAAKLEPTIGLTIPNSKGYGFHEEGSFYYYQDEYFDTPERKGNFAGLEINRQDSFEGKELTLYTYGGGLTEKGLELGEGTIYNKLQMYLDEGAGETRFGQNFSMEIQDEKGVWKYINEGEVTPWGWIDKETMFLNDVQVYELRGTGVCFIPNF